jgi:N,N'-diacetyllegionaminate synthase
MKKVYIIAEVGPNHQGSLKFALKYIRELSKIGVDAVKFQIGIPSEHYSIESYKPKYQRKKTKRNLSIIEEAKKRLLKLSDHIKLYRECKKVGVDYMCSAFDLISIKYLYKFTKFPYIKIPSGEIQTLDTLKFISKKKTKIILSTGMASVPEIKKTLNFLGKKKITLLHCVSDYPTKYNDLNLRFMLKLKNIFNLPVGLSDHSNGILAPIVATTLGARIIEKHVTFSKKLSGPDHKASLTIKEFKEMVINIRNTEKVLGKEKKVFSKDEMLNKKAVRKSCVAYQDIQKGEKISKKHICFKRPGTGLNPFLSSKLLKKKARKFIKKDTVLKLRDFN